MRRMPCGEHTQIHGVCGARERAKEPLQAHSAPQRTWPTALAQLLSTLAMAPYVDTLPAGMRLHSCARHGRPQQTRNQRITLHRCILPLGAAPAAHLKQA